MRDAVRNKERWNRRRAPTQYPSTDLARRRARIQLSREERRRQRPRLPSARLQSLRLCHIPARLVAVLWWRGEPLLPPAWKPCADVLAVTPPPPGNTKGGTRTRRDVQPPIINTRILGRRTAPFPPSRIPNRVPHGFTPRSWYDPKRRMALRGKIKPARLAPHKLEC